MKWTLRDTIATLLGAAVTIPYVGYLFRGEMPFIEDARGMAGTGLVLGLIAFVALWLDGTAMQPHRRVDGMLGIVSLVLGVLALAFAETAAAEALLAVFIISIVVALGFVLLDETGLLRFEFGRTSAHS